MTLWLKRTDTLLSLIVSIPSAKAGTEKPSGARLTDGFECP